MGQKRKRSEKVQAGSTRIEDKALNVTEFLWESLVEVLKNNCPDPKQRLQKTGLNIWGKWTEHLKMMDNGQSKYSIMNPPSPDEYKRVVLTVACAVTNPIVLPWDVERFVDKLRTMTVTSEEAFENEMTRLAGYFQKQNLGERKDPCTLVDRHGRILLWHMPNILTRDRLDNYHDAIIEMRDLLEIGDDSSSSWRLAGFSDNFEIFGRGIKTFSPGWFMQGHDNLASKLHASTSLQNRKGAEFMMKISEVEKLCNIILLLTCPELHDTGMKALQEVRSGKNMHREYDNIELWPSCFTGMQVIVNRTTPSHRDKGGSPPLFDLLVSAGTHKSAKFILPEIGLELSYLPGAVVILCGRIFLHKVPDWEGGERICVAHMMKDNVHDRQDIARPSWPMQSRYLSCIRPQ